MLFIKLDCDWLYSYKTFYAQLSITCSNMSKYKIVSMINLYVHDILQALIITTRQIVDIFKRSLNFKFHAQLS